MVNGIDLLIEGCKKLNIEINDIQIKQFEKYFDMLIETNKVMNLTAITEIDEVMIKHFLDSILVAAKIDFKKYNSMIDVGTGAGFPGIPIKIMFPHLKVTLLDSLNKRLKFLNNVIDELGLEDIYTIHGRAEDIGKNKDYREKYDLCVSRAVANLSTLSEYCIPFISINGDFISYKSDMSDDEINDASVAIKVLGCEVTSKDKIDLPFTDISRKFVICKKKKYTPKKFPRKAGTPLKEPIK